jgi:hypothetical protein
MARRTVPDWIHCWTDQVQSGVAWTPRFAPGTEWRTVEDIWITGEQDLTIEPLARRPLIPAGTRMLLVANDADGAAEVDQASYYSWYRGCEKRLFEVIDGRMAGRRFRVAAGPGFVDDELEVARRIQPFDIATVPVRRTPPPPGLEAQAQAETARNRTTSGSSLRPGATDG